MSDSAGSGGGMAKPGGNGGSGSSSFVSSSASDKATPPTIQGLLNPLFNILWFGVSFCLVRALLYLPIPLDTKRST